MATEIDFLKAEISRMERELSAVKSRLARLESTNGGTARTFNDLEGIWKGVDFTYEDIKAAEYELNDEEPTRAAR